MSIELNSSVNTRRQADTASEAVKQKALDKKAAEHRQADSAQADRAEQVQLSQDAQSLQRVQETLDRQDSFDKERVEEIRQAIGEGRYPIDNDRLARRFMELESQLTE